MTKRIITTPKPKTSRHGKSHHGSNAGTSRFCALDGEGVTLPSGQHAYVMLSVGQDTITNPNGLTFTQICEFLYSHYKEGTAYIGFFLGYDFTQWFKTLPEARAAMLLTREGQLIRKPRKIPHAPPFPVEYSRWQFDILGSKRFRIRPKLCHCDNAHCHCDHAPWMYICDAGGYFQTSFLKAIDPSKWLKPVLSSEEYETIKEGKEKRATAILGPDMERYNRLENDVLERVMTVFNQGLQSIGIYLPPSKWFGPGQAAQEWLKTCAPKRTDIEQWTPQWYRDAARSAYFGGWFEIMAHGIISGISWEYDINSAYPYIISALPCLMHGQWSQGPGQYTGHPDASVLVRATLTGVTGSPIGAMPHRTPTGRINRPMNTSGWYWAHELNAAQQAGLLSAITFHEWCAYLPSNCPSPTSDMASLYQMRLEVGKDTPIGKGCRLVYNSAYGKFAQSVGQPMFANPIYASLITAGCRTMILNAIATHPGKAHSVLMIATDAVYFTTPHPGLRISSKLGEWDVKEKSNLTLFKPGVYWDDRSRELISQGEEPQFKSRGVNARDLGQKIQSIDNQFREWDINHQPPKMTLEGSSDHPVKGWPTTAFKPAFTMVTALQALRRGDWSLAGHVTQGDNAKEVVQSSNPWQKRQNAYYDPEARIYRSHPRKYGDEAATIESQPYDKRFGQENPDNPFIQETKEQLGITPDGYVANEIFDAIRSE